MIYMVEGSGGAQADKVTINNDAADVDFQVKGDIEPDLIRTDAATDRVGIGVRYPAANLHISGTLSVGSGSSVGHITASGNISASGNLIASGALFTSDADADISRIFDTGDLTISSSDDLYLQQDDIWIRKQNGSNWVLFDSGNESVGISGADALNSTEALAVGGNISASGNLIASGALFTSDADADISRIFDVGSLNISSSDDLILQQDDIFIRKQNGSNWVLFDSGNESVGIGGPLNPSEALTVYGNISASGNLGLGSIGTGASYITASISSVVTASLHASGAYSHIRFENLPKTQPNISGALWLSGSDTVGQSKHLVVFTG